MQNHRLPSFFLTNTTVLHQALWLGQIAPDSNISHRWFQTFSTNGGQICLNHSLKGVSSITFIMYSMEWVQPNSAGSNENTSWYSAKNQQAASASSGAQESNPLKSNSLNNLPCLCLTVSLGAWDSVAHDLPPATGPPQVVWVQVVLPPPRPLGFSSRGSVSKPCCSLPPQLPFYFLTSIRVTCFVQWGSVAKSHLWCTRLVPWCRYILQYRPFLPSMAPHGGRRALGSPHSGWTLLGHSHLG